MKAKKFSYSKINTYKSCAWKYKLIYEDGHFINSESLASELGTTVHFIEEQIASAFKAGKKPDYDKLKDDLMNINIPKTSPQDVDGGIFGMNILKEKYKDEYFETDNEGKSYHTKIQDYLNHGIYRIENYLKENPDLEVYDMEKFFSIDFEGHVFSGFIDRIFHNTKTGEYIIEDIKTKGKPFSQEDLETPLQFVIYVLALKDVLNVPEEKIICAYDLPFCNMKQGANTPGYIERGVALLKSYLENIGAKHFRPHPTPLCHWCQFCPTNKDQPEEGKNLCPYYSLWTRENKTREVSHKWRGMAYHDQIMLDEINKSQIAQKIDKKDDLDF